MDAHVAIVFSRYMMLSVAQHENEDDKTKSNNVSVCWTKWRISHSAVPCV